MRFGAQVQSSVIGRPSPDGCRAADQLGAGAEPVEQLPLPDCPPQLDCVPRSGPVEPFDAAIQFFSATITTFARADFMSSLHRYGPSVAVMRIARIGGLRLGIAGPGLRRDGKRSLGYVAGGRALGDRPGGRILPRNEGFNSRAAPRHLALEASSERGAVGLVGLDGDGCGCGGSVGARLSRRGPVAPGG
jgi:hypothetical protein